MTLTFFAQGFATETAQDGLHQVHGERPARTGQQCPTVPRRHGNQETNRQRPSVHRLILPQRRHHTGVRTDRQELRLVSMDTSSFSYSSFP